MQPKALKRSLILFPLLAFILTSCHKDERQAEKSMEGAWNVVSVFSEYGEHSPSGFAPDSSFNEDGDLGSFKFTESRVDYEFTSHDSAHIGSGRWDLQAEKVNAGFTRAIQFTLIIENVLVYLVQFGDQTSNAEKDATSATLITIPYEGYGLQLTMQIEKI